MRSDLVFVATFAAAIGSAIIGGGFFAFSAFVMKSLDRLPPAQGIAAMQSINKVVVNPWFMTPLFGTAAICVALAIASLGRRHESAAVWRLAGSGLYLLGCILVTVVANVPKNDALAKVDANSAAGANAWSNFVPSWTHWNSVRTVAALMATACFIIALVESRSAQVIDAS